MERMMPIELESASTAKAEAELNRIWREIERSQKRQEKIRERIGRLKTETREILKRLNAA